jgi:large subunit ribosomal protein L18
MITRDRREPRDVRHLRLRRRLRGSAERPRLAVFRSINHIYAQLVDDDAGRTVLAVDSRSKAFRDGHKSGGNVAAAKAIGEMLAQKAKAAGLQQVVFDRGGYKYHGRVKALADAARAEWRKRRSIPACWNSTTASSPSTASRRS